MTIDLNLLSAYYKGTQNSKYRRAVGKYDTVSHLTFEYCQDNQVTELTGYTVSACLCTLPWCLSDTNIIYMTMTQAFKC